MSFFSIFSHKDSSFSTASSQQFTIKTMQDDIDILKGIVREKPAQQEVFSQKLSPKTVNPFGQIAGKTIENKIISKPIDQAFLSKVTPEIPQSNFSSIPREASSMSLLMKLSVVFVVLLFIGGGYYFITTRTVVSNEPTASSPHQSLPITPTPSPDTSSSFSAQNPNYLSIDTASITPESLKTLLSQTALQVASISSTKPVEFILTDTKNNPVSFTSFAQFMNMKISPSITNALGDTFSLFIFTENNHAHLSFALAIKDTHTLQTKLSQKENYLEGDLNPLFLGDVPTKPQEVFASNTYSGVPIRFINIHPETLLSVDYSIVKQQLLLSTSKKTHRATIDILLNR
jgi:hypothetical protein